MSIINISLHRRKNASGTGALIYDACRRSPRDYLSHVRSYRQIQPPFRHLDSIKMYEKTVSLSTPDDGQNNRRLVLRMIDVRMIYAG